MRRVHVMDGHTALNVSASVLEIMLGMTVVGVSMDTMVPSATILLYLSGGQFLTSALKTGRIM